MHEWGVNRWEYQDSYVTCSEVWREGSGEMQAREERSMHGETGGGVSEKQKLFDPNRRYNGPLQKREK
jgi:hypothetical protein